MAVAKYLRLTPDKGRNKSSRMRAYVASPGAVDMVISPSADKIPSALFPVHPAGAWRGRFAPGVKLCFRDRLDRRRPWLLRGRTARRQAAHRRRPVDDGPERRPVWLA